MKHNGAHRLATGPPKDNQGTLVGWEQISQYLGLCVSTLIKYRRSDALPVCNLPDNRVFSTKNLIDQWVMVRYVEQDKAADQAEAIAINQGLTRDSSSRPGSAVDKSE